ncbi:SIR2 family protein [Burkholderia cenocepacia]|uniref:SIR2 family protein n=1 Tax=Burkholderia cenocepacia TaxID=95486 RepID=UPI001CF4275B|nr:SIR2 family protein [Burkholderia cenocepacia]MCA7961707.1 SIR2 family protein [Burkholderia cenocepacia]MDR8055101.1 SIR2 family protein [Burkholderia cenocepacia]MDR8065544.1 SIR2 family protein [Burkholderia cenocepacia]
MSDDGLGVFHAIESICEHLCERSAVLFLGAGINFSTRGPNDSTFPLGADLARSICGDLLGDPDAGLDLNDAAEIARQKYGEQSLNLYLHEKFSKFNPTTVHYGIAQLPWDCIYTTNYDTLIETAAKQIPNDIPGPIKPIFSAQFSLEDLNDADIPYYKIHGCIDFANTFDGRLILTREDYRNYEASRRSLFKRLKEDLQTKTFVFIGYGFRDDNLREILDEVRISLGIQSLPPSFALRRNFSKVEFDFWKDKYNVHLLDADGTDFINQLLKTWHAAPQTITSDGHKSHLGKFLEKSRYSFPKVGPSFYRLVPEACVGSATPGLFFRGAQYTWSDARERIAPARDQYWPLMDLLFSEFADPTLPASCYLVTGPAGTGKTTLIKTIAYDVAKDLNLTVLVHIPGTPLDSAMLGQLVQPDEPKRILVVIHDAASEIREVERFYEDLKRSKIPASLLLEERKNEWSIAAERLIKRIPITEVELGGVSEDEIDSILSALKKWSCLGKLDGVAIEIQRSHFAQASGKELLVALREITSHGETSFDAIIRDEFNSIPSEVAKKAYLYVSSVGQANIPLRYEHLIQILGIRYDQLGTEIFRPTDRILINGEELDRNRHTSTFVLRARHPVIASIIFATAADDDEARYQVLSDIISHLDPGRFEDRKLLERIVRAEQVLSTLADPDRRRAIFESIARILSGKAFVLQHRSILERSLGEPDEAIRFARLAVEQDQNNLSIQNTLGMALELKARFTEDASERRGYLAQAEKIFGKAIQRDPTNAYNYLGMYHVMRDRLQNLSPEERVIYSAQITDFLEEALEATSKSELITNALAEQQNVLGRTEDAFEMADKALKDHPADTRLRALHVKLLKLLGKIPEALASAQIGLQFDPNAWRLNHLVARLLRDSNGSIQAIRAHYEAARRHNKGDLALAIEYGAYLFTAGQYKKAQVVFQESQSINVGTQHKKLYKEWWSSSERGRKKKVEFSGIIKSFEGAKAIIVATPLNFEVYCWRTQRTMTDKKIGDSVNFYVGFNAFGAEAVIKS